MSSAAVIRSLERHYIFICFIVQKRVDISIVDICFASDFIVYDRRMPELSNAALHMKQDTTSIEQ